MKKTIKRLISSIFMIVVLLLCGSLQKVYGVDLLFQSWVYEKEGQSYVIYRTYTTPHKDTVKAYEDYNKEGENGGASELVKGTPGKFKYFNNTSSQTSYWVYAKNNPSMSYAPSKDGIFQTYALIFHGKNTIGDYTSTAGGNAYGYVLMNGNTVNSNREVMEANLYTSNGTTWKKLNSLKVTTGICATNNKASLQSEGCYDGKVPIVDSQIAWDTGSTSYSEKYSTKDPWYRMTLVAIDKDAVKKGTKPVFVTDRILTETEVINLEDAAENKGLFFNWGKYQRCIRVTNLLRAKGYPVSSDRIDSMPTSLAVVNQGAGWSNIMLGKEESGLGSFINLFDNILVLPEKATRQVQVRHVNIHGYEQISSAALADPKTEKTEYESVTLDAHNTATINYREDYGKIYLGYNVANTNTFEDSKDVITTKVSAQSVDSKAKSYTTPAFSGKADEAIVVEMYYCDEPAEFVEKHLYYDQTGKLIEEYTESQTYNVDNNGAKATDGSVRTVVQKEPKAGYNYVGAVRKTNGNEPADVSSGGFQSNVESLDLQINQSDPTKNYAYGLFAYQESADVVVRHLVFDGDGNFTSEFSRSTYKMATGETKTVTKIDGFEYLGYKRSSDESIPTLGGLNGGTSTEITSTDKVVNFCYRYKTVNVHVRHILYDSDGKYKKTLEESMQNVDSEGSTHVTGGGNYEDTSNKPPIYYKGYIKTDDDEIPTIYAYVDSKSCLVEGKEVLKNDVYVNFLYQEDPTEQTMPQPEIDAIGKLDIKNESGLVTVGCKSEIYKDTDGWGEITSIPIYNKIKLGIIKQPKYILGAVNVLKEDTEVEYDNSLISFTKDNAVVKTFQVITKIDVYGFSSSVIDEVLDTKISEYSYIFPYKYSEYKVESAKVFKLNSANIYSPGNGYANTTGEKITVNPQYNYKYRFGNDFDFIFEKGITTIPAMKKLDIEMYMDPLLNEGCTDDNWSVACDSMTPVSSTIDGVTSIPGAFGSLIGVTVSGDQTYTIIETVPVYSDMVTNLDGSREPLLSKGIYRYQIKDGAGNVKDIYRTVNNEENTKGVLVRFWEGLKELFADIATFIAQLFDLGITIDYTADEEKALLKQMLPNIATDIDNNRHIIFKMYMDIETKQNSIIFKDGTGKKTIMAKNSPLSGEVKLHSSNFVEVTEGNWLSSLKNLFALNGGENSRTFLFEGYIDMAQTGQMRITEEGKKLYTEGFDRVSSLDAEKSIKENKKYLTDDVINEKNGIRVFAADIDYKSWVAKGMTIFDTFNFKEENADVKDNMYYSDMATASKKYVFTSTRGTYKKDITKNDYVYDEGTHKKIKAITLVNIYTPIELVATNVRDKNEEEPESQLGVPIASSGITGKVMLESGFVFDIGIQNYNGKYGTINVSKLDDYVEGFYLKFDFDVKELKINDLTNYRTMGVRIGSTKGSIYSGGVIDAGTWIFIPKTYNKTNTERKTVQVSAKATKVINYEVSYTARALAKNINPELSSSLETISKNSSLDAFYEMYQNICNDQYPYIKENVGPDSPVYYDQEEIPINNQGLERLYDFKVTDVKDIDWKSVFRDGIAHNGTVYYSGINRWEVGSLEPIGRTSTELGNPTRILPVGPYKHSNGTYKNAPKLGYRISFDVKLTGYYDANKEVKIEPSFYYISKDGLTYNRNIMLYYKNSEENYVPVGSAQDKYKLTFVPNDGVRYTNYEVKEHLSKQKLELGSLTELTLRADGMSTEGEYGMTLYGEYKLPNSTIVIDATTGNIADPNTYLKNGYIGVKFDISYNDPTVAGDNDIIRYSNNLKKKAMPFESIKHTTQWDFEGYLGSKYNMIGDRSYSKQAYMKLENGTWNINDNVYREILGTVVLFDLDSRAATDFN